MYYYTTNTYGYPYAWTTTSTSTSTGTSTYNPYKNYDCSGLVWKVIKMPKGLDKEIITEDMIEKLLKEGDE